ncbi:MAG TPA: hypothetical protein VJ964_17940 [Balneolaceae bacterium]|nr:hypothetical protein [Balneolaceae bacterium]
MYELYIWVNLRMQRYCKEEYAANKTAAVNDFLYPETIGKAMDGKML